MKNILVYYIKYFVTYKNINWIKFIFVIFIIKIHLSVTHKPYHVIATQILMLFPV